MMIGPTDAATEMPAGDAPDAAPRARRFISEGVSLHYAEWGNPGAPPLLLVHGGRDQCRSWDWVARRLHARWHVAAPDLRGHGDSGACPEGRYRVASLVADMAALVHALGDRPVTIVAHSMGCQIALRYAAAHPDMVVRLAMIEGLGVVRATREWAAARARAADDDAARSAPRAAPGYATIEEAARRLLAAGSHLNAEQAHHLARYGFRPAADGRWIAKFDPAAQFDEIAAVSPAQADALMAAVTCPVLLVQGADSFMAESPEGYLPRFRDARAVEMEAAGHWPHHQQFEALMAVLDTFL